MRLQYQVATDSAAAERLVSENMAADYRRHRIDWDSLAYRQAFEVMASFWLQQDGSTVGLLSLSEDAEALYIRDLQINTARQRQGLGRRALQDALEMARQRGKRWLRLRVFSDSRALSLYADCGFVPVKTDGVFTAMQRAVSCVSD